MHGISGYIIVVIFKLTIDNGNADDAVEVSVVNSAEQYTFHDLSPHTDYHITIWAINKAGSGPISTVNVTTLSVIDVSTDTRRYNNCTCYACTFVQTLYITVVQFVVICILCSCRTDWFNLKSWNIVISAYFIYPSCSSCSWVCVI